MKIKAFIFAIATLLSYPSAAATKYLTGKIERIESCKNAGGSIRLYLSNISGTTPSAGNGCSDDKVLPYVRLNTDDGTVTEFEKILYSQALAAHASKASVRIRFDDETMALISLANDY